jgi:tetratricopeptide (TPR) repeat protein
MNSSDSARMRKTRNFVSLVLILFTCEAGLGQAHPSETGRVSGTVKDGAGRGLSNASIFVSSPDSSSPNPRAATDEKGHYTIDGIAFGHYSLSASAEGFRTSQNVEIDVSSASTTADFTLKSLLKGKTSETFSTDNANDSHRPPPSFRSSGVQGTIAPSGYSAGVTAEENAQVMDSVRGLAGQQQVAIAAGGSIPNCDEAKELLKGPGRPQSEPEPVAGLGAIYLMDGEVDRSIPYLEIAARMEPNNRTNSRNLAVAYLRAARFSDASPILYELSKQMPEDADLVLLLAEAHEGSGDSHRAAEEYRKAAGIDSAERVQFASGIGLIEAGLSGQAAVIFATATTAHPSAAKMWMGLGIAQSLQQQNPQAIRSLLRAVELDPAYLPAYFFLANLSGQSEETDKQIRERLETLVAANPESPDAHYDYAVAMWKERRGGHGAQSNQEIETQLELVLAMNPNFAEAHLLLGTVCADSGDFLSAVKELERAARLEPDNAKAHYQLAQAYRRNSQVEQANAEMKRFLALNGRANESKTLSADLHRFTTRQTVIVNPVVPCDLTEK